LGDVKMKLWLDDTRVAPLGWIHVKDAPDAIFHLGLYCDVIVAVSLDHDLGDTPDCGTGYDVITWMESMVYSTDYVAPRILIHTANPVGRARMQVVSERIDMKMNSRTLTNARG